MRLDCVGFPCQLVRVCRCEQIGSHVDEMVRGGIDSTRNFFKEINVDRNKASRPADVSYRRSCVIDFSRSFSSPASKPRR
jgi:hypothetical protein